MSNEWKIIAKRLKAIREARGIKSQTAMAQLIGAEINQYNNWERGAASLPVSYAIRICTFTGATLDYIYRGDVSSLPSDIMPLLSKVHIKYNLN